MAVKIRSEDLAELIEKGQSNSIRLVDGDEVEFFGFGNAIKICCVGVEEVCCPLLGHFEQL